MEEKKIKITIDNYSNILIFVNTQLKITIDEKTNQITGKQILYLLCSTKFESNSSIDTLSKALSCIAS